ncbi:hypothetical protein DID88_009402 [Monilinia fructigena]|uniref:ATP-grasp domain-containing protein n=1 Tax=Monilinia fructigena TaxID=38457 RepID=A0A395IPZ7_9HELO|nr:hypothetical protein DID88_009402 [Monilinia fructigena]
MPLEKQEEELLQWMENQVVSKKLPMYRECRGSWRPDFLVEDVLDETGVTLHMRVCKIWGWKQWIEMRNGSGRVTQWYYQSVPDGFSFAPSQRPRERNGYPYAPAHHPAAALAPGAREWLQTMLCGKGEWKFSLPPSAWRTNEGELVEEIHQVGLELHQSELLALEPEMLRQISLRCFNDFRSILLTHDKRMLGIVKQELESLVLRRVITTAQAQILDRGIADTILPGSVELERLVHLSQQFPELRYDFLLKPIRSGKGAGIVFGDEFESEEWDICLELSAEFSGCFQSLCNSAAHYSASV